MAISTRQVMRYPEEEPCPQVGQCEVMEARWNLRECSFPFPRSGTLLLCLQRLLDSRAHGSSWWTPLCANGRRSIWYRLFSARMYATLFLIHASEPSLLLQCHSDDVPGPRSCRRPSDTLGSGLFPHFCTNEPHVWHCLHRSIRYHEKHV